MVCVNHENIFTTKISRSTVGVYSTVHPMKSDVMWCKCQGVMAVNKRNLNIPPDSFVVITVNTSVHVQVFTVTQHYLHKTVYIICTIVYVVDCKYMEREL